MPAFDNRLNFMITKTLFTLATLSPVRKEQGSGSGTIFPSPPTNELLCADELIQLLCRPSNGSASTQRLGPLCYDPYVCEYVLQGVCRESGVREWKQDRRYRSG